LSKGKVIMIAVNMADVRKSDSFFNSDDVINIIDGRRKVSVGYFVPEHLKEEFNDFLESVERNRRKKLLKRVAKASRKDPIEDGAVSDGVL
jgi:hypothetical protein